MSVLAKHPLWCRVCRVWFKPGVTRTVGRKCPACLTEGED